MKKLFSRPILIIFMQLLLVPLLLGAPGITAVRAGSDTGTGVSTDHGSRTYTNPLRIQIPGDGLVESCADPSVIRGQQAGDHYWYVYCPTDPLNDQDRNSSGDFNFHKIPMLKSYALVSWISVGAAFSALPSWVAPNAGLWAPDIRFFNGQYYLY